MVVANERLDSIICAWLNFLIGKDTGAHRTGPAMSGSYVHLVNGTCHSKRPPKSKRGIVISSSRLEWASNWILAEDEVVGEAKEQVDKNVAETS